MLRDLTFYLKIETFLFVPINLHAVYSLQLRTPWICEAQSEAEWHGGITTVNNTTQDLKTMLIFCFVFFLNADKVGTMLLMVYRQQVLFSNLTDPMTLFSLSIFTVLCLLGRS